MAYTIVSTQNKKNEVALDVNSFLTLLKKLDEIITTFDIKNEYPDIVELQNELRWVIEVLESKDNEVNKVAKLVFNLAFLIQNTFSK